MLKYLFSKMKKVLIILLAVLFVLSLTAVASSAQGSSVSAGYGLGVIYDTPYYQGNPNEDYVTVTQLDYAGDVYTDR